MIFQRQFWDTQLRRGKHYDERWDYVRLNPVRAGLIDEAAEWLYQGELHVLFWLGE